MDPERRGKIEETIERVTSEKGDLQRDMGNIPRLFLGAALAIPAFFFWGAFGAFLVLLASMALVATAYYLLFVRIREAEAELQELRGELAKG